MATECVRKTTNYNWLPIEWRTNKCSALRALATLIYAPPMLTQTDPVPTADMLPFISSLNKSLALPEPKGRLGKYVEELLKILYQSNSCLIAHDLVIQDQQTIGALDFLYQGQFGVHHQEVSFKFYLCMGDPQDMSSWVGPHLNDSLTQKTHRLIHRQSQLCRLEATKKKLDQMNISSVYEEILFKGWLFYPLDIHFKHPSWANNNLLFGYFSDAVTLRKMLAGKLITIANKRAAIGPVAATNFQKIENSEINDNDIIVTLKKVAGIYIETARFYVVKPGWPN